MTPPARTFVMDSPILETGRGDVQVDASKVGTIWGPSLATANGRLRRAISDSTIVEGELGVLHVVNQGSGGARDAYTGRLGGVFRSEDQRAAVGLGIGGGTSAAAGQWGAVDAGFMISGHQETVRPVLYADVGYSAPFDEQRTFSVRESDGTATELRLPPNVTAKLGLGVEMGNSDVSLLLGMSMVKFWKTTNSVVGPDSEYEDKTDGYFAAGFGLRVKVD